MYVGAVVVLQQRENPDRIALAAHGFREMIDHLPTAVGLRVRALNERMGDRLQPVENAWVKACDASSAFQGGAWSGGIDVPLRKLLDALSSFFAWKASHRPRRLSELGQAIRRLDVSGRPLPNSLESEVVRQWSDMRDRFVRVCHHDVSMSEAEFQQMVTELEAFVRDLVKPTTFEGFDEIDAIVEEGERVN
jgi:hypothetical protein